MSSFRRSVTVILLSIFIDYLALQSVNGFLFTHKFQLYLNTLRSTNHEFVLKWDGLGNTQNSAAGFSYATNQNGKFDFENRFGETILKMKYNNNES